MSADRLDPLPLPPNPDLGHCRKRAKDLVRAFKFDGRSGVRAWATQWVDDLLELHGARDPARSSPGRKRLAEGLAAFAVERLDAGGSALSQAQYVIARAHGFESWPKLAGHVGALEIPGSPIGVFEQAVDAVLSGDRATLDRLISEHAGLTTSRSNREHHATLLHYVSANGVESTGTRPR